MTTAEELFARLSALLQPTATAAPAPYLVLHEMLVLACAEGLRDSHHAYSNLASQVDALCRQLGCTPAETFAAHQLRRHCHAPADAVADDTGSRTVLVQDVRVMAILLSKVFQADIPTALSHLIPHTPLSLPDTNHHTAATYSYIRGVVRHCDDQGITLSVTSNDHFPEGFTFRYADTPDFIDHSYLSDILHEGMQINLLDNGRFVVVEPDFLVDISAIANCFEEYGHHPLLYLVNRLPRRPNNRHTLLGNFAGAALDDLVNRPDSQFADMLRSNFAEKALEYCTCPDFDAAVFKQEARRQVDHLRQITAEMFRTTDRTKALLEPSFVCERLGLQGRIDLMTTDFRLLVEQKSGKNAFLEHRRHNRYGSLHVEKHYVQLLLYYGLLYQNFQLSADQTDIRLLYSRYPLPGGLLQVQPLQKLLRESLQFRNMAVAQEYAMARDGFQTVLSQLRPETLNTTGMKGFFYERYLLPQLHETLDPLNHMQPLERAYFCRMMTFVLREQIISKTGAQQGTGNSVADLWNMPLAEKRETGNIFTGLTISQKDSTGPGRGYDLLTLAIPAQADDFLPNFRRGDMVYLYAYHPDTEPDARHSILFKGTLAHLSTDRITIQLNNRQQNPHVFDAALPAAAYPTPPGRRRVPPATCYAVEHAGSDIGTTAAIHALHMLVSAPDDRRQLLLGQRPPRADRQLRLSRSYHPDYDDLLLRARQAQDYFLLLGPPGTGKTSLALRFLVEEELQQTATPQPPAVLLLAYTNRAVDEMCGMLCAADIDFVRLGNPHACEPRYRPYLLEQRMGDSLRLDAMQQLLQSISVVVCTTSTLAARPFLLDTKPFSLTIVDEASQILEPNIIGLLSRLGRFILIGDHKQLPAVVQQAPQESAVNDPLLLDIHLDNCRNALFERLLRTERAAHRTAFTGILHRYGRMHPDLAAFPNRAFYRRERLQAVPLPHQQEQTLGYSVLRDDGLSRFLLRGRLLFVDSSQPLTALGLPPLTLPPSLSDKVNQAEARIVAALLVRLSNCYGPLFDPLTTVGVIVPYRNQIATIRRELEQSGHDALQRISIDTVERYQGSQREVIIYSFTVTHRYQLDFLTANTFEEDGLPIDRKLNVALTRARRQLILIGHKPVLCQAPLFRQLIDHIGRQGGCYDYSQDNGRDRRQD